MLEGPKVKLRKLTPLDPPAEKWISTDMANFVKSHDAICGYYENYPNSGTGWLGIIAKSSDQLIGRAGLLSRSDIFEPAELEIAYVVGEEHQNKGFAKEAAGLLLEYVRQNPYIHRVFLGIAPENGASIKIAESLGLKHEYNRPHFNRLHAYYWYRKSGAYNPEQFINSYNRTTGAAEVDT